MSMDSLPETPGAVNFEVPPRVPNAVLPEIRRLGIA